MRQRKSLHKIMLGLSIIFISAVRLFVVNGKINKERNQTVALEASSKEENKEQNLFSIYFSFLLIPLYFFFNAMLIHTMSSSLKKII
jgi:hypothetical protein